MENNDKYWSDYTTFINAAEEHTGLSPSNLIDRYKILIEELETDNYLEWIYEEMQNEYTVKQIHQLINMDLLRENILNSAFAKEVNLLDERFKVFLKGVRKNDDSWWKDFDTENLVNNNSKK
jgi:hypothetical protein